MEKKPGLARKVWGENGYFHFSSPIMTQAQARKTGLARTVGENGPITDQI